MKPWNLTDLVTTQEKLGEVALEVGQNYDLIIMIANSRFEVRDLEILVSKSKLSGKEALEKELRSMHRHMKETSS